MNTEKTLHKSKQSLKETEIKHEGAAVTSSTNSSTPTPGRKKIALDTTDIPLVNRKLSTEILSAEVRTEATTTTTTTTTAIESSASSTSEDNTETQASEFTDQDLSEIKNAIRIAKQTVIPKHRNGSRDTEKLNEIRQSPLLKEKSILTIKDQSSEILAKPDEELSYPEKMEQICLITSPTLEAVYTYVRNNGDISKWKTMFNDSIRNSFDEIMKYRMQAAVYFETEKRRILRELGSEKLFIAFYASINDEDYFCDLYRIQTNNRFENVTDSLDQLNDFRMLALKNIINIVTIELAEHLDNDGIKTTRIDHYGSDLQCMQDLTNLIKNLDCCSESQKRELIVYTFETTKCFRILSRQFPDRFPDLATAKAYLATSR